MKRILVTGAAGFIGHHLVHALVSQDVDVIGIDNISDFYDIRLKHARLETQGIRRPRNADGMMTSTLFPNYRFQKIDISRRDDMMQFFNNYKFDIVVNLAAQASVQYSFKNPQAYIDSNIVGFGNILEGCRQQKIEHLVYASSSSVYGMNKAVPFTEKDNVNHPISLYAATKRSNELMAYTYSHLYDIPTTGLRFFTVYGPWGRPDMAYYLFSDAIRAGESIKVFNNGEMSRDFTYIDDIVRGVIQVIDNPPTEQCNDTSSSLAKAKVYNIGNNAPVNLLRFIEVLEDKLGTPANKVMLPMRAGDVFTTYADVTSMNEDVGFESTTSIEEGIGKFVEWYKSYYMT